MNKLKKMVLKLKNIKLNKNKKPDGKIEEAIERLCNFVIKGIDGIVTADPNFVRTLLNIKR